MYTSPLDKVKIAAPCTSNWELMLGNDRVRFCGQCNMNVYNLSEMSKREAEQLLLNVEGRLCVRYYQRADGTILTDNCPIGLKAIRKRIKKITGAITISILSFFSGIVTHLGFVDNKKITFPKPPHVATVGELVQISKKPNRETVGMISYQPKHKN